MEAKNSDKYKFKPHPQKKSNFFSDLFFCWTIPMIRTGFKKEFSEEDIYETLSRHDAPRLAKKFEKVWNEQLTKNVQPSLWKTIWKFFKWDILISMSIYFVLEFVVRISRPIALGILMGYFSPGQKLSKDEAIMYAAIIVISSFIATIANHSWLIQYQQIGIKVRVCLSSSLYRKSLRLSKTALHETTIGHVINLLSSDINQIARFWSTFNAIWGSLPKAVLILYILYYFLGPAALAGTIVLIVLTPVQLFLSKKSAFYRLRIALKTDERIRYMSEIISGIQVIKVYSWEIPFVKLIDSIRRKEMYFIKISNYLDALTFSFYLFFERTAIFFCILTYVFTGNNPNAQFVFVVCSFYKVLMNACAFHFPSAISQLLKTNVSIKRLQKFLILEEIQDTTILSSKTGIKIEKASAKWSKDSTVETLSNINFRARAGEIVAIVGSIGSGKSSLLQLCLGELSPREGFVEIGGRISYANQEPWLFSGTVKQNILFGQDMDKEKYSEVIKVCALEDDIALFPYGDNTIVGERGILLSGGQKARISLARAVYRDADIYLLDDPLSAVDASVGKQIFNKCIKSYLKDKCTVLVTHQIQYLSVVDKIYVISNGAIAISGSYEDLQASGEDVTKLLAESDDHECDEEELVATTVELKDAKEQKEEAETRAFGKVLKETYTTYLRSGSSYFVFVLIIGLFVLVQILSTGSDYFLTFWINLEQKRMTNNGNSTTSSISFEDLYFTKENFLYFYSILIVLLIVVALTCTLSFIRNCMKASVKLHDRMFTGIVKATMRFFYTNTSGRILNRFSKDIRSVDEVIPDLSMDVMQVTLSIIGTVLSICIVSPWTLIPTLIIFVVMYLIRYVYIQTSRSIKRLESTNRSPIVAHLTESMKGLTTIRALNASHLLQKEFDNFQNIHSSAFYMNLGVARAFATWLDLVCNFYVLFVTCIAMMEETYVGNVGFLITQGLGLTGLFQWGIRRWSDLENEMTSVERIIEYINVPAEIDNKTKELALEWPKFGEIKFESVSMQYSENDPYVLKNLNVVIKPKEKIGIVGRTGAGKSSLISVLFRLVNFEGNIFIDKVDTKSILLSSLRSKISIIPQEPILFSGSIRKNLDPFDQYEDIQIWNVLDEVKLKDHVSSLPSGLHSSMSEGGSNFSVGQKQLICLARALLRDNKILVLDEATANVDPQTDELLQRTIRTNFVDCTVLTIAHRLHTIMDADKVLVMSDGCIVEFDHPHKLFQDRGVFYDLVMETGKQMSGNLMAIAEKNYISNNQNKKTM